MARRSNPERTCAAGHVGRGGSGRRRAVAHAQEALQLARDDGAPVAARGALAPAAACVGVAVVPHGAGGSGQRLPLSRGSDARRRLARARRGTRRRAGSLRSAAGSWTRACAAGSIDIVTDPAAYRARFADVTAALAWATPRCEAHRSVLVGHSMGAATAMLEAGATNRLGLEGADRFDALRRDLAARPRLASFAKCVA